MKKLIALTFTILVSLSFYADARLVSGTAAHRHDSATGGGDKLSSTTKIAPSIFVYDENAPTDEKYWKFGNASGDFNLFTYDDGQGLGQTVFSITRTGTIIDKFSIPINLEVTGSVNSTTQGVFSSSNVTNPGLIAAGSSLSQSGNIFEVYKDAALALRLFSVGSDGTVSSSKACSSGYTRIGPNFCKKNEEVTVALVRDSCTTIGPGDISSQAIVLRVLAFAISANAILARSTLVETFREDTCANLIGKAVDARAYEFSALPGGIILGGNVNDIIMRSPNGTGGNHYIRFSDDIGNSGSGYYAFVGYFD